MKVLHLLYPGLGGHGNVFFSLVKADENKLIMYEAIFAGIEPMREEYALKCKNFNIPWKFISKKRGLDIGFNWQLVTAIKNSTSSIIFLHGSRFILLAKIASFISKNKKNIVVRETQANHLKTPTDWVWLVLAMLFADRIVFLTEHFKETVRKKLYWIYRSKKMSVINNGIDLTLFKHGAKTINDSIVLGMQSRIVPIKDHVTLLHVLAFLLNRHPGLALQLKIAGEGESLPVLKQLAGQLHIKNNLSFTGMLDEKDLVLFMQSLDIYIHASLGETMSTAIMQAMACKLPVIASDVPGINDMIQNDVTGLLVPVKNVVALSNAVYALIDNPSKTNAIKEAAFQYAQLHFSNTLMFAKYMMLLKSM